MEVLNITFVKNHNNQEILDVICVNGIANGLLSPYTGNTMSIQFTHGNTYVSTFDGGSQGFSILQENIGKITGNLISQTITKNLSYSFYQRKGSSESVSSGGAGKRTRKKYI